MRSKKAGWMMFLGCLLLLSFAATTRYSKMADIALICSRLTILVALSILIVREELRRRHEPPVQDFHGKSDMGDRLLRRLQRWFYDD